MPELSLFVLGLPRLERDGRAVEVERHKALALLAYLAVTGAPHRRDELAAFLWPDLDQTRARAALRRTLSALNVTLAGEWLESDRETIGVRASSAFNLDVGQFHRLLAQCRKHNHPELDPCPDCLPLLAEAASLCRGDFLSGFTLRDAPAFDDWQFFETETLRRELASALERLARAYGERREFETAIPYARRWLALDPLHEPAHCQLMRLYTWANQRRAALRQYAECVRLLESELGVAPQAATSELHAAIKSQHLHSPVEPPHAHHAEVPPALDALVVRLLSKQPADRPTSAQEVQAVLESLKRPTAAPPTLTAAYSTLNRIAHRQLIGRDREWAEAEALWGRAAAGEGQVLWVSGEPGVGKTRMARALVERAQAAGATVLTEGCHAEGGPPYAPLAAIIREAFDNLSGPDLPEFILADLLTLAPHLRPHYPHISLNPSLDPDFERQRMFDSFVTWCELLAGRSPLLMLVEDAHWADSGTLALLRHLARRARKARLLLVMTYRDTEVDSDQAHPLNAVLLDLNRERLAEHIRLARLSRAHTRDLLAAMLSTTGDITPEFLDSLYHETEGNPFFVEEVCKGLIEQGKLYHAGGAWRRADMQTIFIPPSVRGAILARVERLPAPAQEALRLAAIFGREFDFETLCSASEHDEDTLIAALERAERAQLIGETTRAGKLAYTFAHALIPFALRESLSGLRRQRLHRRAANVIETQRPNDVEALVYHFTAAGERDKAIEYLQRAAQRAEALYAYDTAIQHLQTALDVVEAGDQTATRLALLESLADAHRLNGNRADAIQFYQDALMVWALLPNAAKWDAVRLHRKTGETFNCLAAAAEIERFQRAVRLGLENALTLIEDEPPHPESARLLTTLANYAYWGTYAIYGQTNAPSAQGEYYARSAVAMAEILDSPIELSTALEALANIYSTQGLLRERTQIGLQRLGISRDPRFTDQRELVNLLCQVSAALLSTGDYAQALNHLLEAERLANQLRDVGQIVYALNLQIQCLFGLDRWDDILQIEDKRLALEARYGKDRLGRLCFQCGVSAYVHGWRGEVELSLSHREEAYNMMASVWGPLENWPPIGHY